MIYQRTQVMPCCPSVSLGIPKVPTLFSLCKRNQDTVCALLLRILDNDIPEQNHDIAVKYLPVIGQHQEYENWGNTGLGSLSLIIFWMFTNNLLSTTWAMSPRNFLWQATQIEPGRLVSTRSWPDLLFSDGYNKSILVSRARNHRSSSILDFAIRRIGWDVRFTRLNIL